MAKRHAPGLDRYPYHATFTTRWSDNDQYGHLNNAVYYQFYDALVNGYMMEHCGWHPQADKADPQSDSKDQIGLVVSSGTEYYEIIHGFPNPITLGLAVRTLGRSSVEYEIGVFQDNTTKAKAIGRFVHVFVDRATDKTNPHGMASSLRDGLSRLVVEHPKL